MANVKVYIVARHACSRHREVATDSMHYTLTLVLIRLVVTSSTATEAFLLRVIFVAKLQKRQ